MHCLLSHNCPVVIGRTARKVRDRKKAAVEGPWPAGALLQKKKVKKFLMLRNTDERWMDDWLAARLRDRQSETLVYAQTQLLGPFQFPP